MDVSLTEQSQGKEKGAQASWVWVRFLTHYL